MCLCPNTVSLPICHSHYTGELIEINYLTNPLTTKIRNFYSFGKHDLQIRYINYRFSCASCPSLPKEWNGMRNIKYVGTINKISSANHELNIKNIVSQYKKEN